MTLAMALATVVAAVASGAWATASTTAFATASTTASATDSTTSSATASTTAPVAPWSWPLDPRPRVVRVFGPPEQPWLPGHRGVDLRADLHQQVVAPAAGIVTFSGVVAGRGVVVLSHAGGLRSTFEPVEGSAPVGTRLAQGGSIGVLAPEAGHCLPLTCLHWGVLRGRTYLDPLSFVRPAPVILLPLG